MGGRMVRSKMNLSSRFRGPVKMEDTTATTTWL
jgi:hypothetical protein